ncbi:protein spinster homolog 1-like [Phyllobates terribilis]|uniref:protein spinster homolog 1-like n=1 Tax=Phyllobates terribilis TaxID=111132 RepID=UPI003CCA8883
MSDQTMKEKEDKGHLDDRARGEVYVCYEGLLGAHLKNEVKEQIWRDEYVKIFSLLPFNLDKNKSDDNNKEDEKKRSWRLIPQTFSNWLQAFNILASVIGCLQGSVNMASLQKCAHTIIQMFDDEDEEKARLDRQDTNGRSVISYVRSIITVVILSYTNLVIYMNSFIDKGVRPYLQSAFIIEDSGLGWQNIVSIISYVLAHQVFGYLGDRCNRKNIMCAGMSFWTVVNLCISFIPNEYFPLFLGIKGLIGTVEASFSTIAPSIIADLFVAEQRSRMLSIYYFTAPLGCGLGYTIGSKVTSAAGGDWHWAFWVTPGLGLIAVLLTISFVKEPPREAFDWNNSELPNCNSWMMDLKQLLNNKSFILSTLGTMSVKFVASAIEFWAPSFLIQTRIVIQQKVPCQTEVCNYHDSLISGILTVFSSAFGIVAGVEIANRYKKYNPCADPIVCGVGLLISAIFLFLALFIADFNLVATYVFIVIVEILLSMNFSIAADIHLYVVSPTRRSTAQAIANMVPVLLEEVESPYLIGVISDFIKKGKAKSALWQFHSLQYTLMVTCPFVVVIGGGFFFATALFFENDRKQAEMESEELKKIIEEIERCH